MEQPKNDETFESDSTTNIQADAETAPLPLQVQQRRGVHLAIVAVLVLIILLLGGALTYVLFINNKEESATDTPLRAPAKTALTAKQIVEKIKPELNATQQVNSDSMSYSSAAGFKPESYAYYVIPRTESGVGVTGSSEMTSTDFATIKKLLSDNEFVVIDDKSYTYPEDQQGVVYSTASVVCLATFYRETDTKLDKSTASLACADKSSYLEVAKEVTPLYDAYMATDDKSVSHRASTLQFSDPKVADSLTAGYKRASVGMSNYGAPTGGSLGLFYQTPDKDWHYFTNTQNILSCSMYSTDDIKNAYVGEKCSNAAGNEGTVAL